MAVIITNFINCLITAIVGFYLIKGITKSEVKLFSAKTIIWLLLEAIITALLQRSTPSSFVSLIIYCINIIIYKQIFDIPISESVIVMAMTMVFLFPCDVLIGTIINSFVTIEKFRSTWQIFIPANIAISVVAILLFNIKIVKTKLQKFYFSIRTKNTLTNTIFIVLTVVFTCILSYKGYSNFHLNYDYLTNLIAIIVLIALITMYISNKNSYDKLSDEYEKLLSYFQTFEEQIEKEEFNKHEYKNQLAVINGMTKDKKVKDKINEILNGNLDSEQVISQFKNLPKGGMKGLMYYKTAIAKNNKIKLTIDINVGSKNKLKKLPEEQNNVLCKLIGVYFDNAIEAAKETKKKEVVLEIYELGKDLRIVITNSFQKKKNFERRNEKGITTKGKGHGKGLYFAKRLLAKNNWIEENQKTNGEYYTQELIISNKKKEH